ncbi:MAG: hypothetical protein GW778_07760 [Alphaproteobacteria bacterium]|nr:hypothetical protein [Alphaproteobacteria bacterium]
MDSMWLKKQFKNNPDKSKAGLARALRLEPPAISKILSGTRQIKAHEYNQMRLYFELPVDGERSNALPKNAYRLDILAGNDQMLKEPDEELRQDSWVIPAEILSARTQAPPNQIKIFTVKETLMEPDFRRGGHVLVDLSDTLPSPPGTFII